MLLFTRCLPFPLSSPACKHQELSVLLQNRAQRSHQKPNTNQSRRTVPKVVLPVASVGATDAPLLRVFVHGNLRRAALLFKRLEMLRVETLDIFGRPVHTAS